MKEKKEEEIKNIQKDILAYKFKNMTKNDPKALANIISILIKNDKKKMKNKK